MLPEDKEDVLDDWVRYHQEEMHEELYVTCACHSPEHTLLFTFDTTEGEIHTTVFLNQYRGFWKRLWVAIKYLCGYKCRYGHFDSFLADQWSDVRDLREMFSRFIDLMEAKNEKIAIASMETKNRGDE